MGTIRNRITVLGVWAATRLMIFAAVTSAAVIERDIEVYFQYAGNVLNGLVPYRDFVMEYPPGALLFFTLPKILAGDLVSYRQFFVAEMMLIDLVGLLLVGGYARKARFSERGILTAEMLFVTLPAVIGTVTFQRFDLVPAVMVLGAVCLMQSGRRPWAWAVLGLGFAVKLYPVILAPVFMVDAIRQNKLKQDFTGGVPAALGAAALLWLPLFVMAGSRFWIFLAYHSNRGIQLESLYATGLMLAHRWGLPIKTVYSYGSWNVEAAAAPVLAKASLVVMLILTAVVLVHALKTVRDSCWTPVELPRLAGLMILAFILGGKVISPQYLIWVIPLVVLACPADSLERKRVWGLFTLVTLLSYLIYPIYYKNLIELSLWPVLMLAVRNTLLAAVFYLLLKSGRSSRAPKKIRDI